jgi:DNA repair exonuclease SbcCD ATPase subunit
MQAAARTYGLDTSALRQRPVPEAAQQAFVRALEAQEAQCDEALKALRARHRDAQQARQQEASNVATELTGFDSNLKAKREELARLRSASVAPIWHRVSPTVCASVYAFASCTTSTGVKHQIGVIMASDVVPMPAGKLSAAERKAQALPMPLKLANLQSELAGERAAAAEQRLEERISGAAAQLDAAQEEYVRLGKEVGVLRSQRDRLTAASESSTRLRVAQETLEELRGEARLDCTATMTRVQNARGCQSHTCRHTRCAAERRFLPMSGSAACSPSVSLERRLGFERCCSHSHHQGFLL